MTVPLSKANYIHWAEIFDSWRVVPRVFLFICLAWVMFDTELLLLWYVHLPKDERSLEASGFGFLVFTALLGFLKLVYSDYKNSGRDWNSAPPPGSNVVTVTAASSPAAPPPST